MNAGEREAGGTDAACTGRREDARRKRREREREVMAGGVVVELTDYWHIFLPGTGADERTWRD